jgi:hypothetical protein
MENTGVIIQHDFIEGIRRRLDQDLDDKLKYSEFVEGISPFHLEVRI